MEFSRIDAGNDQIDNGFPVGENDRMSNRSSRKPDDLKPGEKIDLGHMPNAVEVGVWTVIQCREVMFPMEGRTWFCREAIVRDQDNNLVIVFLTKLFDNETYEWKDWIKPSVIANLGGYYDPAFPNSLRLTDSVFQLYRLGAAQAFIETENQLHKNNVLKIESLASKEADRVGRSDPGAAALSEVRPGRSEETAGIQILDGNGKPTDKSGQ
jgi:hypothetical protein